MGQPEPPNKQQCGCWWALVGRTVEVHPCDSRGHRAGLLQIASVKAAELSIPITFSEEENPP